MIELVNVEKTYYSKAGDIHALHKTSMSIKEGDIIEAFKMVEVERK